VYSWGAFLVLAIQSHADLYKIGCSSLLDKDYFYKSIGHNALHKQKESYEVAILRMMALNCISNNFSNERRHKK